ncbi:MAG: hypothetical protein WCA49_05625 [Candidatus Sulfotelmatobacter sp.]
MDASEEAVVEEVGETGAGSSRSIAEQKVRNRIVLTINWVMLSILFLGFCYVMASNWFHPNAHVPDLIQNVVWGEAGYFFSLLASFVREGNVDRSIRGPHRGSRKAIKK